MKHPCRILSLLLLTWTAAKAETQLACAPSKPVVLVGEKVQLAVWVDAGTVPTYTWTAAAGKIKRGIHGKATWDLTGVETGPAQAEVEVRRIGAPTAACAVE